jgi:hypothetical protein
MYNENEIELTDSERAQLMNLSREMAPGDLLEERTVKALRDAGHFGSVRRRPPSALSLVLRIAAAIALFAGGVATGRYLIQGETRESASTASPGQVARPQTAAPPTISRPQSGQETVVAEREMWM